MGAIGSGTASRLQQLQVSQVPLVGGGGQPRQARIQACRIRSRFHLGKQQDPLGATLGRIKVIWTA